MTKQKNYSFKGHRTIGNNKSKLVNDDSEGNTSSEIRKLLDTDNGSNQHMMTGMTNSLKNLSSLYEPQPYMGNQMNVPMMGNQMNVPMMGNQMNVPMMGNQMNSMVQQQTNPLNNFHDIDPTMVNTMAPIDENSMSMMRNPGGLMGPSQMAQALGGIANLSKVSNTQHMGNDFVASEASINYQMPPMANQLNQSMMMGQQPNMMGQQMLNLNGVKNLANLNI